MSGRSPPLPVLLVDDDDADLMAEEAALVPLGVEVVRARGGEEALRLLLDRDFACVVMDLMMPRLNGLETAGMIRDRARSRGEPIILLTGFDEDGLRLMPGWRPGLGEYLRKPVDPEVLRERVSALGYGLNGAESSGASKKNGAA